MLGCAVFCPKSPVLGAGAAEVLGALVVGAPPNKGLGGAALFAGCAAPPNENEGFGASPDVNDEDRPKAGVALAPGAAVLDPKSDDIPIAVVTNTEHFPRG